MGIASLTSRILAIGGGALGAYAGYIVSDGDLNLRVNDEPTGVAIFGTLVTLAALGAILGTFLEDRPMQSGLLMAIPGIFGFIIIKEWTGWFVPGVLLLAAAAMVLVPVFQSGGVSFGGMSGGNRPPAGPQPGSFTYGPGGPGVNPAAGQPVGPPPPPVNAPAPPVQNVAPPPAPAQAAPVAQPAGTCPNCGNQNQPDQKFCTGCGTPLA